MKDHKKFSEIGQEVSDVLEELRRLPESEKEEFLQRIKEKVSRQEVRILEQALGEGLFTGEEYIKLYKDRFYDDYGMDSFLQYINAVMNAKVDCFVTLNERMLQGREELEKRFELKIKSPEEVVKEDELYH